MRLGKVVLDAGHGGHDPGAVSKDCRTYEKNITLDIVKRLSLKIKEGCPDVKVITTRSTDQFVSLNDRAEIANKASADLFISIHINSTKGSAANGFSVHTMGQSSDKNKDLYEYNMNVCKRENSVILLEDDYSTKYEGFDPSDPESYIFMQLMQNSHLQQSMNFAALVKKHLHGGPVKADRGIWQNPFYVLWKTSMPSVLLELGFISNSEDLAVLRSESGREKLAQKIYEAFVEYKMAYDKSMGSSSAQPLNPLPPSGEVLPKSDTMEKDAAHSDAAEKTKEPQELYGVQIFVSSKLYPEDSKAFLGYKPEIMKVGNVYKYVISVNPTMDGAKSNLKKIRETYKDAFVVKIAK